MRKILLILFLASALFTKAQHPVMGVMASSMQTASVDSVAQLFITNTGITNPTLQTAINTLVVQLKDSGLWTKFYAIYPIAGSSATQHSYNLVDPRALYSNYYMQFSPTGWTHDSTGMTPDGTSAWADTKFVPTTLSNDDGSLGYYSASNNASLSGIGTSIGCNQAYDIFLMNVKSSSTQGLFAMGGATNGIQYFNIADSRGLFISSANGVNTRSMYLNGVALTADSTSSAAGTIRSSQSVFIGANHNTGAINNFDNHKCIFAFISKGLSAAEVATLSNIINAYETAIGRNTY